MNKGLSGGSIELIDDDIIRKISTNSRLYDQMCKQLHFNKKNLTIKTPEIKAWQWNESHDKFYFDMEYIPSSSFKEFFVEASKSELDNFYFCLKQYLNHDVQIEKQNYTENTTKKLQSLFEKSEFKDFISYLIDILIDEQVLLPTTFCHGDLTLSNILFKSGRYYFIDFLDSHIDTYYYDLSKLKQDLYYNWSLKVENVTNLKVKQCIDYLWKLLYNDYNHIYDCREFQFIDALTLLRIEPYAKEEEVKTILHKCIKELKLYEEFIITSSR
jgi:thiamine kinase-like enzyme